jgi:copper transport protein
VFGAEERVSINTLTTLLFRAGWGKTWWVALVGAFAVTWLARRLANRASTAWAPMTAAVLAFAASQPWTGHAAAAEGPLAARAMQILHVIGAGGWVGGLAALTLVAIPAARSLADTGAPAADARIAALVRAFSPTALAFAAVLAATGAIAAWRNLGGAAPLVESAYGRTLLLKLSLLAIVAGVGAYNWRRVLPTLGEAQSSARLRRSSFIELGAAVVVLIVTAVLVATPMPGE